MTNKHTVDDDERSYRHDDNDMEKPAPAGHNRPPVLTDEEHKRLIERRDELTAAFNQLKAAPNDEATAKKCVELCRMMNAFCITIEEARTKAKAPTIEAGRIIDAEFNSLGGPIDRLIPELKKPILEWMDWNKREQLRTELGALASISVRTTLEKFDRNRIDLEALRPFLDKSAIEKAIRAWVKSADKKKLKGAKILEKSSVTIR